MTSTEYLVGFIVAAVLTNVIILGGVTAVYFLDKRRADRRNALSRPTAEPKDQTSAGDIVEALAPLGSSLTAGSRLRPDAEKDFPTTSQSKGLATSAS